MRTLPLMIATGALLLTSVDFWLSTRPLLSKQRELRAEIAARELSDIQRLKKEGPPPTVAQLRDWQEAADFAQRNTARGEQSWLSRAEDPADYLLERAEDRPQHPSPQETREALRTKLLYLQTELGRIPNARASLGIDFPGATRELSSEPSVLRDQAERSVLLAWSLSCLPDDDSVHLDVLAFRRNDAGRLEATLEVRAGVPEALQFFDRFLEPSVKIAPRRLLLLDLNALPASQWGLQPSRFSTPPLLLRFQVSLETPTLDRGNQPSTPAEAGR